MPRLPIDGQDAGNWGKILNLYLLEEHDEVGRLRLRTDGTLALKENIANKSSDISLGNSDQLYPSQKAVKSYVDNRIAGLSTLQASSTANQVTMTNGNTGTSPTIGVQGPDNNIGMIFMSKGTGRLLFRPGTDATNAFSIQNASVTNSVFNVDTVNARVGISTVSANSTLSVAGSFSLQRTAFNDSNASLGAGHCYVAFSSMTAPRTITLPSAVGCAGRLYIISDELGLCSTHPITIQASSLQLIDGSNSYLINTNYGSLTLISTGSRWKIIEARGAGRVPIVLKTANYSLSLHDHTIICSTALGPITITMPDALITAGRIFIIKKLGTNNHALTIQGIGGQTIDGANTYTSTANNNPSFRLQSDGSQWYIV